MFHLLFLTIFGIPLLAIHFLPTIVAVVRRARNVWWIAAINIFLSWTVIGWIVALIWAIRDEPEFVRVYAPPPSPRF